MSNPLKFIFFGTPEYAAIILEKLIKAGFVPAAVVCNPDRPVGRKKVITPPPTKLLAMKYRIPLWQPEKLEIGNWKLEIGKLGGVDFCIVAAYNKIIPKEILSTLPAKFVGVHPSLLPRYRGSSPIQNSILNGDAETGVTLYLMDEKMDHGPILTARELEFPISPPAPELRRAGNFQFPILLQKLAELGGDLLVETLPKFMNGEINPMAQDESRATYTKKFTSEDVYIEPEDLAEAVRGGNLEKSREIERKTRALNPEPGVWTYMRALKHSNILQNVRMSFPERRVKLLEAEMQNGKLVLRKIQIEGEKPKKLES